MVATKLDKSAVFYTLAHLEALHAGCHGLYPAKDHNQRTGQLTNPNGLTDAVARVDHAIQYMRAGLLCPMHTHKHTHASRHTQCSVFPEQFLYAEKFARCICVHVVNFSFAHHSRKNKHVVLKETGTQEHAHKSMLHCKLQCSMLCVCIYI
jgi:hypothetical protein